MEELLTFPGSQVYVAPPEADNVAAPEQITEPDGCVLSVSEGAQVTVEVVLVLPTGMPCALNAVQLMVYTPQHIKLNPAVEPSGISGITEAGGQGDAGDMMIHE